MIMTDARVCDRLDSGGGSPPSTSSASSATWAASSSRPPAPGSGHAQPRLGHRLLRRRPTALPAGGLGDRRRSSAGGDRRRPWSPGSVRVRYPELERERQVTSCSIETATVTHIKIASR